MKTNQKKIFPANFGIKLEFCFCKKYIRYNNKNFLKEARDKKGVSLIITFFIMIIILAVVIVISTLLYSQIQVIRNIGDSVVSYYAAESGVEKVLYYDRQEKPTGAIRGVCSIFDSCHVDSAPTDITFDHSIFCNAVPPATTPPSLVVKDPINYPNGCDPSECDSCEIKFSTKLSSDKNYIVDATVTRDASSTFSYFNINSVGSFGSFNNVKRAVNLYITKAIPQQVLTIVSATAQPRSVLNGEVLDISVEAKGPNGISNIYANIKNSSDTDGNNIVSRISLNCPVGGDDNDRTCCAGEAIGNLTCANPPVLQPDAYFVDIEVQDMQNNVIWQYNLLPYYVPTP